MKVLNEREKKLRQIAMMNLNVGNKTEKEAAKKFLKDIGLSDESIEKIEGKKKTKVEESLPGYPIGSLGGSTGKSIDKNKVKQIEDEKKKNWKFVKNLPDGMMEIKIEGGPDIGYIHADKVTVGKDGVVTWKKNIKESLDEACDCQKCSPEKHAKCNKPTKKCKKNMDDVVKEEMIADKINSVDSAQKALQAKKINWTKTEKIGNKTIWKSGDAIVGAWDPSWGTIRTGEDLLK